MHKQNENEKKNTTVKCLQHCYSHLSFLPLQITAHSEKIKGENSRSFVLSQWHRISLSHLSKDLLSRTVFAGLPPYITDSCCDPRLIPDPCLAVLFLQSKAR